MANTEILDAILNTYLYLHVLRPNRNYAKPPFKFIAKTQLEARELPLDEWHIEFLKSTLINDGFLEISINEGPDYLNLTPSGIKAAQIGFYEKAKKDKYIEEEIKKQTLENFKHSKYALYISGLTFIFSTIITMYSLWETKKSATTAQLEEIKHRLELFEKSSLLSDTTNKLNDTLKIKN